MANDPYWNSVVLAMHMDDTALTDLKGHAITKIGSAAYSTAQYKFGTGSLRLPGSGSYVYLPNTTDFDFTSAFCIEAFVYISSYGTTWATLISRYYDAGSAGWRIILPTSSSGAWQLSFIDSGGTVRGVSATGATMALATWYHLAVSWDGSTYRVFHDGVLKNSLSLSLAPKAVGTSRAPYIGTTDASNWYLTGYVDDLRITKGAARYTADFTVPTEAFPSTPPQLSGTVLDSTSLPAARTVRSHRRSDGTIGGETTSSASDGSFSLNAYDGSAHYVICLDDDLDENALILDNITPV